MGCLLQYGFMGLFRIVIYADFLIHRVRNQKFSSFLVCIKFDIAAEDNPFTIINHPANFISIANDGEVGGASSSSSIVVIVDSVMIPFVTGQD